MNYPIPIVGAFILNDKNELLLLSSPKWKGKYIIPGGHIELTEKIEDALIREVREETGLIISDIKFLNIDEYIDTKNPKEVKHYVFLNYTAHTGSNKVTLNEEATRYKWVPLQDALNLKVTDSIKCVLKNYLCKQQVC